MAPMRAEMADVDIAGTGRDYDVMWMTSGNDTSSDLSQFLGRIEACCDSFHNSQLDHKPKVNFSDNDLVSAGHETVKRC